jgi:agmatinase
MEYPPWSVIRESHFVRGHDLPMIEADMPTFMRRPHAIGVEDLRDADVAIIGSSFVAGWSDEYAQVPKIEWAESPKRVRQQSARYTSGYIADFDVDVFEHLRMVDFGDAELLPEALHSQRVDVILRAQAAVEEKVAQALAAGVLPIVIGQNSPCATFAVAKTLAANTDGDVGMVSLDTHWDAMRLDRHTADPRIAGSGSWLHKTLELVPNMDASHVVEIGPRGMLEHAHIVRDLRAAGATMVSGWDVRRLGIEQVCERLDSAYDGTANVYTHIDFDVVGGNGGPPAEILADLAEPLGLTDYDVLRIAYEVGRRGVGAVSLVCIAPGSALMYRLVAYAVMYLLAGRVAAQHGS